MVCVVGSFFTVCVGTVDVVTTLVLSGCGSCGKWANWGCGAAFQYSVVVTGLVVTSSLLFQSKPIKLVIQLKSYLRNIHSVYASIVECLFDYFAYKTTTTNVS